MRRAKLRISGVGRGTCGALAAALGRRQWLTHMLLVGASTLASGATADDPRVPPRLQAELLAKVAAYDGHFAARAAGRALVLVLMAAKEPDSERFAAQIRAELAKQPLIGGVEHREEIVRYSSPAELSRLCRERRASVVYVGLGLSAQVVEIADALAGVDVLSVAAVSTDVARGVVLGFEVLSGKPRLTIHLTRARRQNVAFRPELLRLARVIQ